MLTKSIITPEPSSYATRVKAITNNVQRNVDSKEIAQLKEVSHCHLSQLVLNDN